MHPRYRQFGFKDEDGAEVGAFVRHARELGLSRNQIDSFLEMNRGLPADDPEAVKQRVGLWYDRYQLPQNIRAALEQHLTGDSPASLPPSNRAADAKRLAEIREIARNEPDRHDNDPWLSEEHHNIMERMGSPDAGSPPGAQADGAGGAGALARSRAAAADGGSE